MNPWRAALLGGLLYALPYAIWLVGGVQSGPTVPDMLPAHRGLLWAQAISLLLLLPAVADRSLARTAGALCLLIGLPWPLLVLFGLNGAVPFSRLIAGQLMLLLLALVLAILWHAVGRIMRSPWQETMRAVLQGAAVLSVLSWLGSAVTAMKL